MASVFYQRVKTVFGADGTISGDVQLASTSVLGPLPVSNYQASDYVTVAGLGITPKWQTTVLTADGTVVNAPSDSGKKIRVLAMVIGNADAADGVGFEDGSGGTTKFQLAAMVASAVIILPFNPVGWFEGSNGNLIHADITVATSGPMDFNITYIEV